jgi:Flp pilus assembly protein TadG
LLHAAWKRLSARLGARIGRAMGDERGAVAVQFAFLALPIALLCFGLLDMNRVGLQRRQLQEALDASTLIAARASVTTDAQLDAIGDAAFAAEIAGLGISVPASASTFKSGSDNSVVGTAQSDLKPIIANLWTNADVSVTALTTVKRAQGAPVELVMVLDTTGSMAGAKLTTLKTAATSLVDKLTVSGASNVKIGVVPFAQYVNVGIANRNQSWVSVPADYSTTTTTKGVCTTVSTKTTCQTQTYACTKYTDGVPYASTCSKSINCVTKPITPVTTCTADKVTTNTYKFYGCVGSPAYPKNVTDTDPSRVYPGFMNLTCATPLTPLVSTVSTVKAAITALTATGDTYIPSGLAWGFNMLSSAQPLTDAAAYDATGLNRKPRKAMVLMTDGANSKLMNAGNGRHDVAPSPNPDSPATGANTYTAELCTNIKAKNIEVFTVAFNVTDAGIKTILKSCATDSSHYFDATDTVKLMEAFQSIADALRNIYIAK